MSRKHLIRSDMRWTALFLGLVSAAPALAVTKITRVEFLGKSDPHQIMITGDGPIEFEKIENAQDRQVIFELKNSRLANRNVARRIDTSSFDSKVSLISPYEVESQNAVRIIVQLREGADVPAITSGNRLVVGIDGQPDPAILAALDQAEVGSSPTRAQKAAPESQITQDPGMTATSGESIPSYGNASGKGQDGQTVEERLDLATSARTNGNYVGSRITIQVKDAAVGDVFRLIGEASGFNIILGNDVTGNVTLSLVDVPWDLALDTILSTMRLGAERRGNVLRVSTLATLTQEKQLEQTARRAAEAAAPRVTRIVPVSYADPQRLIPILQRFGGGAAGSAEANRDTILLDDRTNSLVIQDIPENITRMVKMIELLDKPTPQVLIESKIVEASENLFRSTGGSLGVGGLSNNSYAGASFANAGLGALTTDTVFPLPGDNPNNSFFGAGISIARLTGIRLRALLSLSESEGNSKTISSPRTLVLNRQQASIVQGTPVLVPIQVINAQSGLPTSAEVVQQANLSLQVRPTVTNDGNIIMDLQISSDEPKTLSPSQTGIGNRNVRTQVVAESGTTIVIGGVYKESQTHGEGGFPLLRKIPILGRLFGGETNKKDRSELLIFVSPKVINEGELTAEGQKTPTQEAEPSLTTDQGSTDQG